MKNEDIIAELQARDIENTELKKLITDLQERVKELERSKDDCEQLVKKLNEQNSK
jgi:hypothetical protein